MNEKEEHVCCLCGKKFLGYGNNPYPLKKEGVCCDECNKKVIKKRLEDSERLTKEIQEVIDTWF